ncbi:hypothetical protein C427_4184 [Paraglaciecola psychrophila 170]|uniref:Uncharacterized protein n=2 Tax=Paraglaciecola TaxID=1621534 RepID=M4RVN3_9ALTE|nr:hypothetical protein C427_4184 [Paraglaciecola psychrophila 170]
MVFLDRHRAEVLYWLFLFFMAAHNVFLNKNKHSESSEANKDSFK